MNLIADSNVWYDIASGRRNPAVLKRDGHRLIATPISLLEIASRLSDRTFSERRDAAKAVLYHADEIAIDTETHLAKLWDLEPVDFGIDWKSGFVTIALAQDVAEIVRGVNDFGAAVVRRVNVQLANQWRTHHWEDFMHKVEDALDSQLPGYKQARLNGRAIHMNQTRAQEFERDILSAACRGRILLGTYERALLVIGQSYSEPTRERFVKAAPHLEPYLNSYCRYLIKCGSTFAPQANDWGDLEMFIYLQGDNRLLTKDQRWVNIAQEAGSGGMLLDPEIS